MSVTHHMLNEESRKYFQQGLVISGSAQNYKMYVEGDHRCLMNIFSKNLGKQIENNVESLIAWLKDVPEQDILDFAADVQHQPYDKLEFELQSTSNVVWVPIVEGQCQYFGKSQ